MLHAPQSRLYAVACAGGVRKVAMRIHAWDRLSVATRRQHTLKSVVAFRQTAGETWHTK
jgi:hypothetical protein